MNKNIIISIVATTAIICGLLYFTTRTSVTVPTAQAQNTEIRDGIQYVTVVAKGGYSPKLSSIKPGIPTKLIIKTNGTYDCSASLSFAQSVFKKF